jgi:hypothetical protein
MSTIEKELKKEEVGSGCCGTAKQDAASHATKEAEAKKIEAEKEKKSGSGCCGG